MEREFADAGWLYFGKSLHSEGKGILKCFRRESGQSKVGHLFSYLFAIFLYIVYPVLAVLLCLAIFLCF